MAHTAQVSNDELGFVHLDVISGLFGHIAQADQSQHYHYVLPAAVNRLPAYCHTYPSGRTRRTWLHITELDFQQQNVAGLSSASQRAQDCSRWHQVVMTTMLCAGCAI